MVTHTGRHSDATYVTLNNNSCNAKSGTLTIIIDSHYNYYYSYPSGSSVSGHTITYSYSGLTVDSPQTFLVYGSISPWITVGTHVTTTAYVDHLTGDASSSDDTAVNADTVTASWDPNDKQVSPKGNIPEGALLTYTLSFENTGNAAAKNIHILDTLDANVNPNSLQVITSSFPVTKNVYKITGGRTAVRFDFVNINLLDTTHPGQCDGFVMFSVNAKTGIPAGTLINNRAGIYFDDNEVVMTNTVMNTVMPLSVPILNNEQVLLYPNPVHDVLTIKTGNGFDQVTILNSMGQVLQTQKVQSTQMQLDMHALVPGMYYIMLRGSNGVKVEKIEKL